MLIHRRTFLDAGGFDPHFWAYFEDVDLGWRLWLLGHKVVYAPNAVVQHMAEYKLKVRRAQALYPLGVRNSLATVLKDHESGNMESILSTALLLLYKRALLAAGDAIDRNDYKLSGSAIPTKPMWNACRRSASPTSPRSTVSTRCSRASWRSAAKYKHDASLRCQFCRCSVALRATIRGTICHAARDPRRAFDEAFRGDTKVRHRTRYSSSPTTTRARQRCEQQGGWRTKRW